MILLSYIQDKEVKYLSVLRASLVSWKENVKLHWAKPYHRVSSDSSINLHIDNIEVSTNLSYWKVSAFSEVEKLGQASPAPASLPIKKDVAKIMSNLRNNLYTILAYVPFLVVITNLEDGLVTELEVKKWPDAPGDNLVKHFP
uniref:Uncharacterized protein n=1 Tax=Lactuca sativa TaxID=4236 RepID=A0A9R1VUX2_LACSA|nr:hypothetical protein LSAT_V11C400221700 [Lactuca sativa]